MGQHDHARALVGQFADGRRLPLDAQHVDHAPVLHRHVQIGAHQHALALHVEGRQACGNRSMARFRSACPSRRRCRPCGWRSPIHCRTSPSRARDCPSITLVWSSAKEDESGLWLKSWLTSGASTMARMPFIRRPPPPSSRRSLRRRWSARFVTDFQIDQRNIRRRHAHRNAVELAFQFRHHEAQRLSPRPSRSGSWKAPPRGAR